MNGGLSEKGADFAYRRIVEKFGSTKYGRSMMEKYFLDAPKEPRYFSVVIFNNLRAEEEVPQLIFAEVPAPTAAIPQPESSDPTGQPLEPTEVQVPMSTVTPAPQPTPC